MKFDPALGTIGNIQKCLTEITNLYNSIIKSEAKSRELTEHKIIEVEQQLTDCYLDNIEAQQMITEIELKLIGGNENDI